MPRLVISVSDFDAAVVAAKSYLKHHPDCDVTTYTRSKGIAKKLEKADLNPVVTQVQPIEKKIIKDLMENSEDLYGILLSQYSFTRAKVIPLDGDRGRMWDVAARPPHPFLLSDAHAPYSYADPEFERRNITSNFYFGKDILALNLRRLRKFYSNIAPMSKEEPWHELNVKLRQSQRGVIPGEAFSSPETVIQEFLTPAMLLRHQHRLRKNFIVAFNKDCLYWDNSVPMKILMQMNLRDYLECCNEYSSFVSKRRIKQVKTNIERQEKRFGKLIEAFAIYNPVFLN